MNRNGKVAKISCRAEPFDKTSNTDFLSNKEGMIDIDDTKAMFKILKRNNFKNSTVVDSDN